MVALMISSQLLLTGFVTYWLISQYHQEKIQLHSKLKQVYFKTHDQLIDTLLMQHLIAPSLHDSLMVRVNITENHKSETLDDARTSDVIMKQISMDSLKNPEIFAFHLKGLPGHDSLVVDSGFHTASSDEEMLVRSVKLFISEADESFRNDPSTHAFSMQIDSVRFKNQFKESLLDWGEKFTLTWEERGISEVENGKAHGLLLKGYPIREIPVIRVQQYSGYLIRLILPQLLFAMILLGLSASALLIAYRSLKKQLVLNKLRDDFIGNISHELKTPVSTVKVALEALRTFDLQKDPKVSGEYLEMASRELERLEGLVGKVLHHQALEDPSVLLQKEKCDLRNMVQKVIQTLEIPIREKGAEVIVDEKEGPCNILVDPVYMEGVIINLIDNSLKYAGPGPKIHIQITCDSSGTSLSVKDNGPGIPHEFQNQVFDKFFRIPAGNRHDVKGYGLGLNFASQVMTHHGGSISVRNLTSGGCQFSLYFPNE